MDGLNIIGVQFRRAGRIYDFVAGDVALKVGDDVVVETERGPSLAKVAVIRFDRGADSQGKDLKPILRVASSRDLDETRKLTPEHALAFARERVERLALKMMVLQSEVQFGGNKVIVYFSAPGRVDFRELVKELASGLKARVELKQVGARDEAKLVGGIGICGREFCCSSFLREFVPVSIKMAKNQNLALNPSKVSGGCGRLLCCLTYENDLYTELRRKLPPRGTRMRAPEDGVIGDVIKADILNQLVVLEAEDGRQLSYKIEQLEVLERSQYGGGELESEAEAWGEDIDLAALADLDDDSNASKAEGSRGRFAQKDGRAPQAKARGNRGRGPEGEHTPRQQGQADQPRRGEPRRDKASGSEQSRRGRAPQERHRHRDGRPQESQRANEPTDDRQHEPSRSSPAKPEPDED